MKIRLLGALVGLVISFALPIFAQQKETVDPQTIEQLIAFGKKYDEAQNNNDAASLAAFFTEDAVLVTNTGPVYGRQAIEKWFTDDFHEWRHSNKLTKDDQNSPRIIGTADNIASSRRMECDYSRQDGRSYTTQGPLFNDSYSCGQ